MSRLAWHLFGQASYKPLPISKSKRIILGRIEVRQKLVLFNFANATENKVLFLGAMNGTERIRIDFQYKTL
jgi:hypothetical protein